MKKNLSPEVSELINVVHYRPAVSMIVPFETKMGLKAEARHELKFLYDQVERQLLDQYPVELAQPVLQKIMRMIDSLSPDSRNKGVAIYASPVFEKLLYLDVPVTQKIIINDSFEIRDLVFSKKELHNYLLLSLSSETCKLYLGNTVSLMPLKLDAPNFLDAYWHDEPERVANFSDPEKYKEIQVEKLIRQMDKELDQVLRTHELPVFVVGSKPVLGLFRSVTHHAKIVKGYLEGNYQEVTESELIHAMQPALEIWRKARQEKLLRLIEEAANEKKLECGIQNVWHEVYQKKGRLHIVEKDFMAACEHVAGGTIVYKPTSIQNNFNQSIDVVDDAIELVLQNGGDVEFVDNGFLWQFEHIALIKFYH
jgi:hypothetical protein